MPIALICGACEAKLNAPDAAAGKKVKCPKCGVLLEIPRPEAEADYEVVEEAPTTMMPPVKKAPSLPPKPAAKAPPPAAVAKAKPKPVVLDEDDDNDRPAPKKKSKPVLLDDDEDERPAPKKKSKPVLLDDEDEYDDEPKPKKKGKKKPAAKDNTKLLLGIGGGVVALALVGFLVYWFALREPEVAKTSNSPNTPGGSQPGGPDGTPADPFAGVPRLQPVAKVKLPDGFSFSDSPPPAISADGMRFSVHGGVQFSYQTYVVDFSAEPKILTDVKGGVVTPRGDAIVTHTSAGSVLSLPDKKPLVKEPLNFSHLGFIDDNTLVYTMRSYDFTQLKAARVAIRDLGKGTDTDSFQVPDNRFGDARFTDNGTRLWLFMSNKKFEVECWDVPGKRLLRTVKPVQVNAARPYLSAGTATSVSADGAVVTSSPLGSPDQLFFDTATGKALPKLPTGLGGTYLGFLPFGQIYCAARREPGKPPQSVLYNTKTLKVIAVLDECDIMAVSADGKRAVGLGSGGVVAFDLSSLNLK